MLVHGRIVPETVLLCAGGPPLDRGLADMGLESRRTLLTVHGGVGDLLIVERDARDLHFVPGKGRLDGDVEPICSALLPSHDEQRPLHRQQRCLADCLCLFPDNPTASPCSLCPTLPYPTLPYLV